MSGISRNAEIQIQPCYTVSDVIKYLKLESGAQNMAFRNLIDFDDVSTGEWDELYRLCCDIMHRPSDYSGVCRGRVMASLFYEPSTRTTFSFQAAMLRLGGSVFGFSDPKQTSISKGETL